MQEQAVAEALAAVEEVPSSGQPDPRKLSLDSLALLVNTHRVRQIETKIRSHYEEVRERQTQLRFLHKLMRVVNASTDSKGGFNISKDEELQKLFEEAKAMGIEIPVGKTSFNKEDKDRLVENIRLTCEDLNLQNEMQIQQVTRLTHERYESFQLARSILKPLHDDKINKARAIAGR